MAIEDRAAEFREAFSSGALPDSATFWTSIVEFMRWDGNWDGLDANKITLLTAVRATRIVELALNHAPEPFVAPAGDGSLMLEWSLPNGAVVGTFIPGGQMDAWEPASVTRDGQVVEYNIKSADGLVDLIRKATSGALAEVP